MNTNSSPSPESDYEARCRALGINRGQLESGFEASGPGLGYKVETYVDRDVRLKVVPPPIDEDLSRFGPQREVTPEHRIRSMRNALKRSGSDSNPLYRSLMERGMTVAMVSRMAKVPERTVFDAFRPGHKSSQGVRDQLSKFLTAEERQILGWR